MKKRVSVVAHGDHLSQSLLCQADLQFDAGDNGRRCQGLIIGNISHRVRTVTAFGDFRRNKDSTGAS